MTTESFPRLAARTQNFTLGQPRSFRISPDGQRIAFLRAPDGTSRSHDLWVFDVATGEERRVADAGDLARGPVEDLSAAERARRERMRVRSVGIVAYDTDREVRTAVFTVSSRLFVADLTGEGTVQGGVRALETAGAVVDPHLDPTGRRIAYACARGVRVVELDDGTDRLLIGPAPDDPDEVVWGLAEFAAAEELDRTRGFWWAPDGGSLLVERYDESPVELWTIADPANPAAEPNRVRYPQAGTANALVSLWHVTLDGARTPVDWSSDATLDGHVLEYLAEVTWIEGQPLLSLLTRDQRRLEIRSMDVATGATRLERALTDEAFVELLPGTPRWLPDGRLLHGDTSADTYRLAIDGQPFTPAGLQVRAVEEVLDDAVAASVVPAVPSIAVARLGFDGSVSFFGDPGGVSLGVGEGDVAVLTRRDPDRPVTTSTVRVSGRPVAVVGSVATQSPVTPRVTLLRTGSRDYPTAVVWPREHVQGSRKLPVLADPYGGPHGQRVLTAAAAYLQAQWFADQGFVVIVADGRGQPGRGPAWDRLAKNDFIGTVDDQADVVASVAQAYPDDVDASTVAIRGWSFGGYLAAAAVLTRPDVFHAAVAGAPVTDQRLYDTAYSERYLGHPETDAAVYERNDLVRLAPQLTRPLLLVHGLADDNVVVAHTLQLSSALLAAGKPHDVLPLSGMTHMADSEVVAENLLLLELDFLRRALALPAA